MTLYDFAYWFVLASMALLAIAIIGVFLNYFKSEEDDALPYESINPQVISIVLFGIIVSFILFFISIVIFLN